MQLPQGLGRRRLDWVSDRDESTCPTIEGRVYDRVPVPLKLRALFFERFQIGHPLRAKELCLTHEHGHALHMTFDASSSDRLEMFNADRPHLLFFRCACNRACNRMFTLCFQSAYERQEL